MEDILGYKPQPAREINKLSFGQVLVALELGKIAYLPDWGNREYIQAELYHENGKRLEAPYIVKHHYSGLGSLWVPDPDEIFSKEWIVLTKEK